MNLKTENKSVFAIIGLCTTINRQPKFHVCHLYIIIYISLLRTFPVHTPVILNEQNHARSDATLCCVTHSHSPRLFTCYLGVDICSFPLKQSPIPYGAFYSACVQDLSACIDSISVSLWNTEYCRKGAILRT